MGQTGKVPSMQYQMSGAAAPQVVPQQQVPVAAHPQPQPPPRRLWWILAVLIVLAGAAFYYARATAKEEAAAQAASAGTRTAVITSGAIRKTLRLTGTTGAERFSSMIVPTLRGARGQGGRGEGRTYNAGNTNASVASNSSRSSGSSGASSTGASTSSLSGTTVASTAGQSTGGGSQAFRAATSRVSRPATPARSSASSSGSAQPSATSGNELGSTGAQLNFGQGGSSGGQGGGGGGDFGLVLQDVAKPGSKVRKGDTLAEFDRQFMMNRVDDYRASVTQTEASVTKLRAELEVLKKAHLQKIDTAKATLDKARLDLKTTSVLGAIEAERLKLAAEEAEAQYKQLLSEVRFFDVSQAAQLKNAEYDLQQARIELRRAEANANRMVVKSPIAGLVVMQNTFRGGEFSQIQQGDQLFPGMSFMQIVDTSSMVINAIVNQVDVDKLRIGAKATVRFDAFPGLALPAHVYAIAAITKPGGMRAQFVKEIPVKLKLDTIDPRVIPDLSVSADVLIEEEQQASIAPLAAIHRDGGAGSPYVFVRKGNEWERRPVELGLANYVHVAIRQGVKPGEEVALDPPTSATDTKSS